MITTHIFDTKRNLARQTVCWNVLLYEYIFSAWLAIPLSVVLRSVVLALWRAFVATRRPADSDFPCTYFAVINIDFLCPDCVHVYMLRPGTISNRSDCGARRCREFQRRRSQLHVRLAPHVTSHYGTMTRMVHAPELEACHSHQCLCFLLQRVLFPVFLNLSLETFLGKYLSHTSTWQTSRLLRYV